VDYYKIPADFANTFQKAGYAEQQADPIAFLKKATQQHDTLCRIFTEVAGVAPIRLSAKNGLYDAVFTSDPFITIAVPEKNGELKRLIIPSKFSNTGREPEVAHSMRYLKTLWPDAKIITPTHNIEGSGDNTYDCFRGVYWSGFKSEEDEEPKENEKNISAGRSDKEAHAVLQSATGIPVHSIELIGDFFHIDTILCPLPNGHIMVYPGGMTPESFAYFKKTAFEDYGLDPDEYMIEVSEEDAYAYACNARGIDNNVTCTPRRRHIRYRAGNARARTNHPIKKSPAHITCAEDS